MKSTPTKLPYVSVSTMFALRNMRSRTAAARASDIGRASPPRPAARTGRGRGCRWPAPRPIPNPSPGLRRARTARARAPAPESTKPGRSKRPGRALAVFAEVQRAEHEPDDADRQVDVEDPPPRHVGDEPAADDRAERGRENGRDDQHRRRLRPFDRRERAEQHRGADRRQHAAADTLQHAERDELAAGCAPARTAPTRA